MAETQRPPENPGEQRLKRIMDKLTALAADLEAFEDELPAPSLEELQEMAAGKREFTYEAVFLGLVAMINVQLDEVVTVFGKASERT